MKKDFLKETLCWRCANSLCDGCDWSKFFKPIEGWTAKPNIVDGQIYSYNVEKCPKFLWDRRTFIWITYDEIAKTLGVGRRTVYYWTKELIKIRYEIKTGNKLYYSNKTRKFYIRGDENAK